MRKQRSTNFIWLGFIGPIFFAACSSSKAPESKNAEVLQELQALKKNIQALEQSSKSTQDTHAHEKDDEHGSASHTEIEILKLLQAQNAKILSIEQRLAQNAATQEKDPAVIKNQIIEEAKKELSAHQEVGPGYVTSAQLIQVVPGATHEDWMVTIKFKKSRTDPQVWLATIPCQNKNAVVTCEPAQLAKGP